jgi:hypothetical protein
MQRGAVWSDEPLERLLVAGSGGHELSFFR